VAKTSGGTVVFALIGEGAAVALIIVSGMARDWAIRFFVFGSWRISVRLGPWY